MTTDISKAGKMWHAHQGGNAACTRPPADGWACPYSTKASAVAAWEEQEKRDYQRAKALLIELGGWTEIH